MSKRYTCTLTSDFTGHPKLGVRNHDTKELEGAFYTEDARRRYMTADEVLAALGMAEGIISNIVDNGKAMLVPHRNHIRAVIAKATGRAV